MNNAFDLVSFGEVMLRLSPPRHARIVDSEVFEKRAGGAELNVACGGALLGLGSAGFFMLWQRLFASQDSETGTHDLILGTAISALLYFSFYLI
ncbi:MAG: hypothetical protein RR284_01935, partial [Ruthenibacterium sp.]